MQIKKILSGVAQHQPSDLHLQAGSPPALRVGGSLTACKTPALEESQLTEMLRDISPEQTWKRIESGENVEFMYLEPPKFRWRVNVFHQGGKLAGAIRVLPYEIPSLKSQGLPEVMGIIAETRQGLALVGGRSGSGRSCTVAAMVNAINQNRTCRIVELVRSPEYEHVSKKALVAQIRIGVDVANIEEGFDAIPHFNADVVALEDLDDWSTINRVLGLCDAGTLVIATTLSVTTQNALERLRGFIPKDLETVALRSLSLNFQAICCQRLCRKKEGTGRIPAIEVLRRVPAVLTAMDEGDFSQLEKVIGSGQEDMRSFDQDLNRLVRDKQISEQEAMRQTLSPDSMQMLMRGFGARTS